MKRNTKQKLIEVGAKLMLAKSYHAAGLKEILDEADVPKGSFYNYFSSKEDFGIAIIQFYGNFHADESKRFLADKSLLPCERLKKLFLYKREHYFTQGCNQGCLLAKLTTELAALSPRMCQALKEAFDQQLQPIADCIHEGQKLGYIGKEHNPEELAEFIHSAWEGAVFRMQLNQDTKPLDVFIGYLLQMLSPNSYE
jgi:TetR/AcrR family transcriptional regulator, transcriptional repressor for nem operon